MGGRTTLLEELQRMKERMDEVWDNLLEKNVPKREELSDWAEELPKFEGTRRRNLKSRSNRTIRSL
jgi:hypothetical protein